MYKIEIVLNYKNVDKSFIYLLKLVKILIKRKEVSFNGYFGGYFGWC